MISAIFPSAVQRDARMSIVLDQAIRPDEVSRMVLAAIQDGQFYIHTDRVMLRALEERHREIIDAIPHAEMDARTAELSSTLSRRRSP